MALAEDLLGEQSDRDGGVRSVARRWAVPMLGAYSACVTLYGLSATVSGPFSPSVVGSMADWIAGLGAAGAVLIGVTQLTAAQRSATRERRSSTIVGLLMRAYETALDAAATDRATGVVLLRQSMNLSSLAQAVELQDFIKANDVSAVLDDGSRMEAYVELLVSAIGAHLGMPSMKVAFKRPKRGTPSWASPESGAVR